MLLVFFAHFFAIFGIVANMKRCWALLLNGIRRGIPFGARGHSSTSTLGAHAPALPSETCRSPDASTSSSLPCLIFLRSTTAFLAPAALHGRQRFLADGLGRLGAADAEPAPTIDVPDERVLRHFSIPTGDVQSCLIALFFDYSFGS